MLQKRDKMRRSGSSSLNRLAKQYADDSLLRGPLVNLASADLAASSSDPLFLPLIAAENVSSASDMNVELEPPPPPPPPLPPTKSSNRRGSEPLPLLRARDALVVGRCPGEDVAVAADTEEEFPAPERLPTGMLARW